MTLLKLLGIVRDETHSDNKSIMRNQTSANEHAQAKTQSVVRSDSSNEDVQENNGTFANQDILPRLPIPTLEETMKRFVQTIRPLLTTQEERNDLEAVVNNFMTKRGSGEKDNEKDTTGVGLVGLEGIGAELQTLLQEYDEKGQKDKSLGIGSYIEEFWSDAYLAPDTSVVLNLNPFFLLEEGPDAKVAKDQILRASSLCFHSLKLAALLKNERMTADKFKGTTLCMDQFKALFGSARIPKADQKDVVEVDPGSRHVAVLVRNQFYYFTGLWPPTSTTEDGEGGDTYIAVSESDIAGILKSIMMDARKTSMRESSSTALGVLTTLPRKAWAKSRDILVNNAEHNRKSLEVIDSALFVLVLDEFVPADVHDAAANMLHGTHVLQDASSLSNSDSRGSSNENLSDTGLNGTTNSSSINVDTGTIKEYQGGTCCNRWYDKLQVIVCSDGSAGVNFEHSAIDGHTALRMVSDVYAETVVTFAKSITKSIYTHGCPIPTIIGAKVLQPSSIQKQNGSGRGRAPNVPTLDTSPKKINFEMTELVKDRIFYAETALGDAISADDTYVLEYKGFGKNRIVANKFSPDAVVQMSIVLSYYKLYGEVVCAYESVLTKQFFHGRTEAMRSTTSKAVDLCTCWTNQFSSKEEKLQALRDATQHHSKMCKEASQGKGVDRHLYALKCIAEKNNIAVPDFFKSKFWALLNTTVLSTSNCGNPSLRLFGFGPVIPSGFGIGYVIRDDGLQFSISSKHRQTRRYANVLKQTLNEIGSMMKLTMRQSLVYSSQNASTFHSGPKVSKKASLEIDKDYVEFADGFDDTYGETSWCCPKLPLPERLIRSNSGLVGRTALRRKHSLTSMNSVGSNIASSN